MRIEEFRGGEELGLLEERLRKAGEDDGDEVKEAICSEVKVLCDSGGNSAMLDWDTKRLLVGAGARALFYPTLLYNVVRNKIQAEFRWWDWIDEFLLLGAIPFRSDVKRLKVLGVGGVVTLNEPYETLVPSSLYQDYGICHLVLPTRDYLFAPSLSDISRAVDFIHENASCGQSTYVHCKAGRGRSTTVVICYLVKYKHMMPEAAYSYVKSIRPRVLLASSQWQVCSLSLWGFSFDCSSLRGHQISGLGHIIVKISLKCLVFTFQFRAFVENIATPVCMAIFVEAFYLVEWLCFCLLQAVQNFFHLQVKSTCSLSHSTSLIPRMPRHMTTRKLLAFDDCSVVVITQADLDGYAANNEFDAAADEIWANLGLIYKVRVAGESALSRLSCLWLRCPTREKTSAQEFSRRSNRFISAKKLGGLTVNVHVY